MNTNETIEFLTAPRGEPSATQLLFGLAGVAAALEELTTTGDGDRDKVGNLATAADCIARLLIKRMGECPVGVLVAPEAVA